MSAITMLPSRDSGNIYTVLLYRALESAGLRYVDFPYSLRYVLRHGPRARFHYVHFHWPEVFFNLRPRAPLRLFGFKGYLLYHALLCALKLRGYRIVWTVHELDVHDLRSWTWAHAWSRRLLWKLADLTFAHTPDVAAAAVERWGAKPYLETIPIGSYDGAYPAEMTRAEARARLGIAPTAFTFVFFGNVRPYKGIDVLLEAFRDVVARHPEAHLLIAGKPYSPEFRRQVEDSGRGLPNLHLALGYVPDAEIQVYLRAADCFVAPYKYIETCSAIYLALAFDLPVIIKSEGNVVDFEPQGIGIFLRDASDVGAAMRAMLEMPAPARARLRAQARAAAERYSWDTLRHRYRAVFDRFEADHGGRPAQAAAS